MHKPTYLFLTTLLLLSLLCDHTVHAQRQMEYLQRGVVAVQMSPDSVYVGWRLLGTDPEETAFNLYRQSGNQKPVKLNKKPLTESTNFIDTKVKLQQPTSYFVRPVLQGKEQAASEPATVWAQHYLSIPLQTPEGYTPNDASVADLDGDGVYEIVLHQTGRSRDTPAKGLTDEPIFQAYKLDGTLLWTINLGKNIREGAHYTQFIVYDLDGDGKAELACKTADGTTDGTGKVIGDASADWRDQDGKILRGPEFFTIFDGETGKALATTDYIPGRGDLCGWGGVGGNSGNDCSGNRVDRFLAGVGYLDGERPSVVMGRGYYGRSVVAAWDWRDGTLTSRWVFDSENGENPFSGQGNHSLSVNDVDGDGHDEIVYGAMVVDHDGKGLYSTGLRHGDALHVSRFDSTNPDQLVWGIHENETNASGYGVALFNARTGKIIWGGEEGKDVGRGLAADIDPRNPGAEMWWNGSKGLYNVKGERISDSPSSTNFGIWWDGDLLRELLDRTYIDKWDYAQEKQVRLFTAEGCLSNNGTKATPALTADLFGDWREEVMFRTEDNKHLRIYTTTIPTNHRLYTLMHDPQYRTSVAWQNVGYNQPPHPSFFLGHGMPKPPRPNIRIGAPKEMNNNQGRKTGSGAEVGYKVGKVLYEDTFAKGLDNWIVETPPHPDARVVVENGKLLLDVNNGATVWFREKLSGNVMIEYTRKVLVDQGKNDRLSDFNQFWMATDPRNKNLFTRTGVFGEYDPLLLYYVGFGGNDNSTTRFRKYTGTSDRTLHQEHTDAHHLLQPNKEYHIRTTVYNGLTRFYVDGELYFEFKDPEPLTEGHFGFRILKSRQEIDNFKVYRLR